MTAASVHPGRGAFITLEGVEGAGKSTNLAFIGGWLQKAGKVLVLTREPGGVPLAEQIRGLLLRDAGKPMPPMSELLLMFAARAAHLDELIRPALARGEWVVSDRFTDASYAYQGGGRGLSRACIGDLENMVQGGFRPDLTLLLDASWEGTRARREQRGTTDRFETEGKAFFDRVRAGYLERAHADPGRIRIIDAERELPEVHAQIEKELSSFHDLFHKQ